MPSSPGLKSRLNVDARDRRVLRSIVTAIIMECTAIVRFVAAKVVRM